MRPKLLRFTPPTVEADHRRGRHRQSADQDPTYRPIPSARHIAMPSNAHRRLRPGGFNAWECAPRQGLQVDHARQLRQCRWYPDSATSAERIKGIAPERVGETTQAYLV